MLSMFFNNISATVLVIIGIMAYLGLSEVLLNYITEKKYVMAGIVAVIATGFLGPKFAVIEAVIVIGRILYRKHKAGP